MPKRIEYIDVAKFLGMVLVIFTHAFKECHFVAFIFAFHLPLFFFLSGMTLKVDNVSFGDFLVKKLKRYIVPMFGLGLLGVLFEHLVKYILNIDFNWDSVLIGVGRIINQTRTFAIWFLPSLFFSNLMVFGLHRLSRGNVFLTGLLTLPVLGVGIIFNLYHNISFVWNFDAALFGLPFSYFGFLLRHPKMERVYAFLTGKRLVALGIGVALLVVTYYISVYNYETYRVHLEMFRRVYRMHYVTLPCALLGCLGFVLFCRGISNFVIARPVEMNLILLQFHQVLAFPLFREIFFKDWWRSTAWLPVQDYRFVLMTLAMTAFSVAILSVLHLLIKYSPLSLIVNQPLPKFYYRKKADTSRVMLS